MWSRLPWVIVTFFLMIQMDSVLAQTCDPLALSFNTTPDAPYESSALRAHLKSLSLEPKDAPVLLLGDSQLSRWPADKLDSVLGKGRWLNFGVSGDRVQNVLWRLKEMPNKYYNPKTVVISAGTNNLGEPACAIKEGLKTLLYSVRNTWPQAKIIMFHIFPRGDNFREKQDVIKEVYDGVMPPEVHVINMDDEITCGIREFSMLFRVEKLFNKDISPCANYSPDLLHLSDEGYDLLGIRLVDALDTVD